MNIMISAVGMDAGLSYFSAGGTAGGAAFVVVFSFVGLVLLVAAGCLLRGCRQEGAIVPHSLPRF
jgi:hypothetical protein